MNKNEAAVRVAQIAAAAVICVSTHRAILRLTKK